MVAAVLIVIHFVAAYSVADDIAVIDAAVSFPAAAATVTDGHILSRYLSY